MWFSKRSRAEEARRHGRRAGRHRALAVLAAGVAVVAVAAACEQVDVVVEQLPAAADAEPNPPMDAAAGSEAAVDAAEAPDADTGVEIDADADTGAPLETPCAYRTDSPPGGAPASLADRVAGGLGRAVCTCTDYSGSGALTVDAATAAAGADVGIDGALDLQLPSSVAGALIVAGTDGVSLGPDVALGVGRDLAIGGPLEGAEARVTVTGDAAVAGRIDLIALEVGGTLTQSPGEPLLIAEEPMIGEMQSDAVAVPPPCDCDPATLLDVGALVRERGPSAETLPEGPLPAQRCAEYALDGGTVDALSLEASESAAIYVSGDLALDSLAITVAAGAVLDVFLEGNLQVGGALALASETAAGAVRFHVGGTGTINLPQGGALHGTLYAPNAELVLRGPLTITGAMFVRRAAAADAVVVHHEPQSSEP